MSLFSKFTKGNHSTEKSIYPWSQRKLNGASHALPRFGHGATMLDNQHFIIYGGIHSRGNTKKNAFIVNINNISATSLSASGDIPSPRSFTTINSTGGLVLLYGGEPINAGEIWDPYFYVLHTNSRLWSRIRTKGKLPSERASHSTCISKDGIMYIWGGHYQRKYLNDLCAFNVKDYPTKAEWEFISYENQGPSPRSGHVSVIHENKLYIFGGVNASHVYNDIWYFDLSTRLWHQIAAVGYIPVPRESCGYSLVDDTIYIFGGRGMNGTELGDLCAYRIKSKRWYTFQNMGTPPSPRYGSTLTMIQNKIYVFGGESMSGKIDDSSIVYILDCSKIKYRTEPSELSNTDRVMTNNNTNYQNRVNNVTLLNDDNAVLKTQKTQLPDMMMARNRPLPAIKDEDQKPNGTTVAPTLTPPPPPPPPLQSMEINQNRQNDVVALPPPRPPREGATLGDVHRMMDPSLKFKRESNRTRLIPPATLQQYHLDPDEKKRLSREIVARDVIINEMKKKEQWWRTEVSIARHLRGIAMDEEGQDALLMEFNNKKEELNEEKLMLFNQLVHVKGEIKKMKGTLSNQTETFSKKLEYSERVRTVALEEAAYYKAKYVALKTRSYDQLEILESGRVQVLENRLAEVYEHKMMKEKTMHEYQAQSIHDRAARLLAEDRARDAQKESEKAQEAHQHSLEKLSKLYQQIIRAEAKGRSDALVIADLSSQLATHLSTDDNKNLPDPSHIQIELSRLEVANIKSRNEIANLLQKLEESKDTELNLRILLNQKEEAYKESVLELERSFIELELLKKNLNHTKSQLSLSNKN